MIVRSVDGTPISAEGYGEGTPGLIVVPGALTSQHTWKTASRLLSAGRTVFVLDRRGRGRSGDAPEYAPEREVEDVLAFLQGLGEPVDLLGHSSGAILALQAAQRTPTQLRRLVLYEPPVFFAEVDRAPAELPDRLEATLSAGDRDAALEMFLREGPRASEAQLAAMRAGPAWAALLDMAHTVVRDARIQGEFDHDPAGLRRVRVPTLMVIGGASPRRMRAGAETIAGNISDCSTRDLPGQEHLGMLTDPAGFSDTVDAYLRAQMT